MARARSGRVQAEIFFARHWVDQCDAALLDSPAWAEVRETAAGSGSGPLLGGREAKEISWLNRCVRSMESSAAECRVGDAAMADFSGQAQSHFRETTLAACFRLHSIVEAVASSEKRKHAQRSAQKKKIKLARARMWRAAVRELCLMRGAWAARGSSLSALRETFGFFSSDPDADSRERAREPLRNDDLFSFLAQDDCLDAVLASPATADASVAILRKLPRLRWQLDPTESANRMKTRLHVLWDANCYQGLNLNHFLSHLFLSLFVFYIRGELLYFVSGCASYTLSESASDEARRAAALRAEKGVLGRKDVAKLRSLMGAAFVPSDNKVTQPEEDDWDPNDLDVEVKGDMKSGESELDSKDATEKVQLIDMEFVTPGTLCLSSTSLSFEGSQDEKKKRIQVRLQFI